MEQPRRSSTSPWLIGCGIALMVVLLGGGGGLYAWYRSAVITDPAEVATHAGKILPGVKVPAGMVGAWGLDTLGMRMAVLGPPDTDKEERDAYAAALRGMAVILVGLPAKSKGSHNVDTTPDDAGYTKLGDEALTVGGLEVTFERGESEKDGNKTLHLQGLLTKPDGRLVHITFLGPAKGFDDAVVKAFLGGVKPLTKSADQPKKK